MPGHRPSVRLKCLRCTSAIRSVFREASFRVDDLVHPIFVDEGIDDYAESATTPGVMCVPENQLSHEIERHTKAGIKAVMTFGVSHHKDATDSDTWREHGLVSRIARAAKEAVPVAAIRKTLDAEGFDETAIMSHSTKLASSLYGPFREADGLSQQGDPKTYQTDPMNRCKASLDEAEGADALMVKPAGMLLT